MDKLKNFPSVYSPTVIGREDRANYMLAQAEKYNLNLHLLPVKDYHTNRDSFKVSGPMIQPDNFGYCTFISYLQCMKKWYEETKEDNLIICDDDIDFSTSEHWPFTWEEFYSLLPSDWDCVQLVRIRRNLDKVDTFPDWKKDQYRQTLILTSGSTHPLTAQYKIIKLIREEPLIGGIYLLRREYVKKLLNIFIGQNDEYYFDIVLRDGKRIVPSSEALTTTLGESYNIPIFVENISLDTTYYNCDMKGDYWQKVHVNSRNFYYNFWENNAKLVTLKRLMTVLSIDPILSIDPNLPK